MTSPLKPVYCIYGFRQVCLSHLPASVTVQFVSGDDKQPMDKSSRYTIFGRVAEIRDAIPCDLHVERRSERKAIGLSSAPPPRLSIERGRKRGAGS